MNDPIDPVTNLAARMEREYRLRVQIAESAAGVAGGKFVAGTMPDFVAEAQRRLDRALLDMALDRVMREEPVTLWSCCGTPE